MVATEAGRRRRAVPVLLSVIVAAAVCCVPAFGQSPAESQTVWQASAPADRATVGGVLEVLLFYFFAGTTLISALALCISKNVVRMAVWLFFTLGSVAVLYFLLLANFIAVIQLIVYVGGTLILLVFGVMLTSKSPWVTFDVKRAELLAAALVCLIFGLGLVILVTTTAWPGQTEQTVSNPSMGEFGWSLLTTYLVPFEVVSVLLLVVLIGAAYLARQE